MKQNRHFRSLLFPLVVGLLLFTAVLANARSAHFVDQSGAGDLQLHQPFAKSGMICKLRPDLIGTNMPSSTLGEVHNVEFLGQIGGTVSAVAVQGNYAYVADGREGLRIIDVSNSAAPTERGFYDTPGFAIDVSFAGNTAYVADGTGGAGGGGLRIINMTNPASPTEVGSVNNKGSAEGVAISGSTAYIAGVTGLRIVDVANPASPADTGF